MEELKNTQYCQFILQHIARPYQSMIGYEKRIEAIRFVPFGKNTTTLNYFELFNHFHDNEKWISAVIERLSKIYSTCDYSFFPFGDPFAMCLKLRMIESGIKPKSPFEK